MNRQLRGSFAPLFGLFEIKTIVLCLRNRAIGRSGRVESLLAPSLLADELKEILLREAGVRATISAAFPELETAYDEGNLAAFENDLMRAYLEAMTARSLEPPIRAFFTIFIDMRNLVLLYKSLRWRLAGPCPFIRGGSIAIGALEEIAARNDDGALDVMLRRVSGRDDLSVAQSEGALETLLLRSMTAPLMRARRSAGAVAPIVAYLWRLYIQARNLAVIHHAAGLEAPLLERELVL